MPCILINDTVHFPVQYIASRARFLLLLFFPHEKSPFVLPCTFFHRYIFFGLLTRSTFSALFLGLGRLLLYLHQHFIRVLYWTCVSYVQLLYCVLLRLISAHFIGCCVWTFQKRLKFR